MMSETLKYRDKAYKKRFKKTEVDVTIQMRKILHLNIGIAYYTGINNQGALD